MKIVRNCNPENLGPYHGFQVSEQFVKLWNERHPDKAVEPIYIEYGDQRIFICCSPSFDTMRTDQDFISLLEEVGSEFASGPYSRLEIVEIPDEAVWEIEVFSNVEVIHTYTPYKPYDLITSFWEKRKLNENRH